MIKDRLKAFTQNSVGRLLLLTLGIVIMIISPIIGAIPGPGGVFVFAIGLALTLRSSRWVKRRYVDLKKWRPQMGRWTDWGLRRKSAKRRADHAKRKTHQVND